MTPASPTAHEAVQPGTRRRFTASEKLRLVKAAEAAVASGERGALEALLRKEGIYSSHLSSWRLQFAAGGEAGLVARTPGRKPRGAATGVVLRWDGSTWSRFADTAEPLSGVWTAPSRALYVGGNRGYLARFGADDSSNPDPGQLTVTIPVDTVDFHALAGANVVVAVGADLLSAGTDDWRGTIASHGQPAFGSPLLEPGDDAGVTDAGTFDAPEDAAPDAPDDAPVDAPIDAPPADAPWPTAGQLCGFDPQTGAYCATGLACWYLVTSNKTICTKECAAASECGEYGANACCRRLGPQTLRKVCIPSTYVECN